VRELVSGVRTSGAEPGWGLGGKMGLRKQQYLCLCDKGGLQLSLDEDSGEISPNRQAAKVAEMPRREDNEGGIRSSSIDNKSRIERKGPAAAAEDISSSQNNHRKGL